tara:strand:- start:113690 stop:114277 length:588 start_codon:yes stop_codon:yes gene_type:complete
MSDLTRHLPLSSRARRDESSVESNWSRRQGELLLAVAEILEAEGPGAATHATLRAGVTVEDLARSIARTVTRGRRERTSLASESLAELTSRIRALAMERLAARTRVRVPELGATLADAWELALALGRPLAVTSTVSGAVALARSLAAPMPIRAVVRGRRLIASDAGWEIGSGPPITGSAAAIVLFLYGHRGVPGG